MDAYAGAGDLRASDDDRERQAEIIRQAASEGRLTLTELDERLEQVYSAKTYAELAVVTRDLPGGEIARHASSTAGGGVVPAGVREVSAFFSEQKIKGQWMAPRHLTVRAILGSVKLDFTEASMPQEVVIDSQIVLGELQIVVPEDVAVELEPGTTILGERNSKVYTARTPGTPVIKIRGTVFLGEVQAKPPPKSFKKWLRRGKA
ncbi:DUF1707 SHOCT-like domain-containing protein [Flindersiella endophytica]